MKKRALFIFRRDLRLEDNTALNEALKIADEVITAFIFTPEQIEHNPYKGIPVLQFMIESLEELGEELRKKGGKLYLFSGHPEDVISDCIEKYQITAVFVNADYTPYSIKRDKKIQTLCHMKQTSFHSFHDLLLHPPDQLLKSDSKPYTVFTPFYKNGKTLDVQKPKYSSLQKFANFPISFEKNETIYKKILPERLPNQIGGRKAALHILNHLKEDSNHLSPHLKFTTCSSREAYHKIAQKFGPESSLIRSLYWRDFFTLIAYHFPHVFGSSFQEKYQHIRWEHNEKKFHLWTEGKTGFPIVDAGMRELNATGNMSGRLRMITASFLIKDLHIDWMWGEKYFAKHLIDYDPAVNNGNWQWVASTGCDAQPYFRIFNPWLQQAKFDPECLYIKKWIPELSSFSPKTIHRWYLQEETFFSYPLPMLDHQVEAKKAASYMGM